MSEVPKDSPEGLLARAEWLHTVGFDVAAVLNDEDWHVQVIDGYPEIVGSDDALRALALMAPHPDAAAIAEEIITRNECAAGKP